MHTQHQSPSPRLVYSEPDAPHPSAQRVIEILGSTAPPADSDIAAVRRRYNMARRQFLAEMDGVKSSNEGLLILAATNAPWHLDSAFRRPGRFDRVLFIPPPDATARAAILRLQCKGKPMEDIDYEQLGRKADHFSGADLKAVVDHAIERKLQEALKAGVPKPITHKDLAGGISALKPTTREWFATARNYALYSNQGGIYDEILQYLKL